MWWLFFYLLALLSPSPSYSVGGNGIRPAPVRQLTGQDVPATPGQSIVHFPEEQSGESENVGGPRLPAQLGINRPTELGGDSEHEGQGTPLRIARPTEEISEPDRMGLAEIPPIQDTEVPLAMKKGSVSEGGFDSDHSDPLKSLGLDEHGRPLEPEFDEAAKRPPPLKLEPSSPQAGSPRTQVYSPNSPAIDDSDVHVLGSRRTPGRVLRHAMSLNKSSRESFRGNKDKETVARSFSRSSSKSFGRSDSSESQSPSSLVKSFSAEDLGTHSAALTQNFWLGFSDESYTASITPYRVVQPDEEDVKPIIANGGFKMKRKVCLFRHANRLPTADTIKQMKERLHELFKVMKQMHEEDIANGMPRNECFPEGMETWQRYRELEEDDVEMKTLVQNGIEESQSMGKRFKIFYSRILPEEFDKNIFSVKFTDCPRTRDTAKNVIFGIYDKLPEGEDWYEQENLKVEKSLLKYDSSCTKWKLFKKSRLNEHTLKSFLFSKKMEQTLAEVHVRCQFERAKKFKPKFEFTRKDLVLAYEACSFETAWIGKSYWCGMLTIDHMKIMEFSADLDLHMAAGYSNILNTKIPCILFDHLMDILLNHPTRIITYYFTHLTSILKFLAFLGVYHDLDGLTQYVTTYDSEAEKRQWRTTYIGAFLTNICIILFKNDQGDQAIQVRHQERALYIPFCPERSDLLCPLDKFLSLYERFSNENCLFDFWCSDPEGEKELKKSKSKKVEKTEEKDVRDLRRIKSTGDVKLSKSEDEESTTESKGAKDRKKASREGSLKKIDEEAEKLGGDESIPAEGEDRGSSTGKGKSEGEQKLKKKDESKSTSGLEDSEVEIEASKEEAELLTRFDDEFGGCSDEDVDE